MTALKLTDKWDKVFPKSDKVEHKKVTFHKRMDCRYEQLPVKCPPLNIY